MKRILKYPVPPADENIILMPAKAEILCVQVQRGTPQIWVIVDELNELEPRRFHTYGTGHTIRPNPGRYIGTYQLEDGDFVGHLYEF